MNLRTYSTEAIILSRRNYGEADRLLTVFTKRYGKLHVIAKGIRRLTSRKKGSLELFNYVRIFLAKGNKMDIIIEAEIKDDFPNWRKDLKRIGVAYHLVEVLERLTVESQGQEKLFGLLVLAFEKLDKMRDAQLPEFIRRFKMRILEDSGFLEKDRELPIDVDDYIEDLINFSLKTRKFLRLLR